MQTAGNAGTYIVSIRAPREGRDDPSNPNADFSMVSIRAPREGRDTKEAAENDDNLWVSIRAPREGRDCILL